MTHPQKPLFGLSLNYRNSSLLAFLFHELTNPECTVCIILPILQAQNSAHFTGLSVQQMLRRHLLGWLCCICICYTAIWLPESVISHHWLYTYFSHQLPMIHLQCLFSPFSLPLPLPTLHFRSLLFLLWATVQRFSEQPSCFLYLFSHIYQYKPPTPQLLFCHLLTKTSRAFSQMDKTRPLRLAFRCSPHTDPKLCVQAYPYHYMVLSWSSWTIVYFHFRYLKILGAQCVPYLFPFLHLNYKLISIIDNLSILEGLGNHDLIPLFEGTAFFLPDVILSALTSLCFVYATLLVLFILYIHICYVTYI